MKCFTIVRGKRMRATRLDECGNPPEPGALAAFAVTKGFVSVGLSPVSETGDEIIQKNADGDICINDRTPDQFRRWDVQAEFCGVDPGLLSLLTNVTLEEDWQGEVVGVRQPEGASVDTFGLELWTGVPGEDCAPGEETNYGYLLLPFLVPGTLGDITIENGATTFTLTGSYTRGGGAWGVGPYDVIQVGEDAGPPVTPIAGPLMVPMDQRDHLLLRTTTVPPPEPDCDLQAMPAAA